jgi:hypothetical protein
MLGSDTVGSEQSYPEQEQNMVHNITWKEQEHN